MQNAKHDVAPWDEPAYRAAEQQEDRAEQKTKLANLRKEVSLQVRELERMNTAYDATREWAKRIEYREGKKVAQQRLFELTSELRAEKQLAKDRRRAFHQRKRIRGQLSLKRAELRALKEGAEAPSAEQLREYKQEILRLRADLLAAKERERAERGPVTGALPDFLIIGAPKCGTTSLYYLLAEHPHVEPAAAKELHFFSSHFDLGMEWYRRCFPRPEQKDGRSTITGEATPSYLGDLYAPGRVAEVVPQVRLLVLLRNPVDRAFSHFQMAQRKGWATTATFEEAVGAEHAGRLLDEDSWYLSGGIYADQLARWSSLFGHEQILVLRSEDFSRSPEETLERVLGFLGLPDWKPQAGELHKKLHTGGYEQEMQPATRRRLEEYFGPHNRRLYTLVGEDFGW